MLNGRLAADMKPLIYQVRSACDYVKAGAAWLSGQRPPNTKITKRRWKSCVRASERPSSHRRAFLKRGIKVRKTGKSACRGHRKDLGRQGLSAAS